MEYAFTAPAGWTPPQNATLLARISADTKKDQHGVEGQIRELRGFARNIGAHIKTVVQENNRSGYKEYETTENGRAVLRTRRPDLQEILREARAGRTDGLLVAMDDRLGRNERDAADLVEIVRLSRPGGHNLDTIPRFQVFSSDGSVNLLTEDGCQAYLNRIAAHRAYCDSIRKKVTRSHRLRAQDGIYHGGYARRYGYVLDHSAPGRLRKVAEEVRAIRRMADMILAGDSAQDVVRDLIARKVPVPFKRDTWDHYMVRDILLSPIVAGRSIYRGEDIADGLWERIISREEQDQIERMLDYPRRPTYHHKPRVTHLGSGLYRCGLPGCDGLMWANSMAVVPERYASRERGYSCRVCGGQRRRISWVDADVEAQITDRLSRPDAVKFLERTQPDNGPEIAEITARLEELERQSREVRRRLRAALLTDDEADEDLADIRKERDGLRASLQALTPREGDRPHPAEGIAGNPDAAKIWAKLSLERKRAIIDEIAVVEIGPSSRHGRTPSGSAPDTANIWVRFRGDAIEELRPVTRDTIKEAVREIVAGMFDGQDSVPVREGRSHIAAALRELGYGVNVSLINEVVREQGIIARQVSATGWEWHKAGQTAAGVCEGCGKEFTGYRKAQRFCSRECRLAAWKDGQGPAATAECEECGKEYRSANSSHRFCSWECRRASWLAARGPVRKASPVHGNAARNCEQCGGEFQPYRKTTRYCSEGCRLAARREKRETV